MSTIRNQKVKSLAFYQKSGYGSPNFWKTGFLDVFRELYPENVQYTYWSYINNQRAQNNGWRLDYFLISAALLPMVKDVETYPEVPGSDHCPVSLILEAQ